MADHQFEKKVSRQMAGFELKPSAEVWQQVEAQLQEDRRRRRWFFLLFPVGLLLMGGLTYGLWPSDKDVPVSTADVQKKPVTQKTSTESRAFAATPKNELPAITDSKTISTPTNSQNENVVPEKSTAQTNRNVIVEKKTKDVLTKTPLEIHTKSKTTRLPAKMNEQHTTVLVEKQTNHNIEKEQSQINSDTQTLVITERQKQDNIAKTEQPVVADSNQTVGDGTVTSPVTSPVMDTVALPAAVNKPVITPDTKWKLGLHTSAGIADIRESFFPGTGFRAESTSYFGNTGTLGGAPINGASRVVVYEYAIQPSLQYGAGIVVRKKFANKHAFVSGLLYQYNSYSVTQRERIDTFISSANSFTNVSTKDVKASFRIHTINLPLEWELPLANAGKGSLRLGAGVHNWFSISSTQTKSFSAFRYDRSSAGAGAGTKPSITQYQPVLHLAPIYEWSKKKQTFQAALFFNYGLRPVYESSAKDYWWQTGVRFRIYFSK